MAGAAIGLRSGEGGTAAIALRLDDGHPTYLGRREPVLVDPAVGAFPYHAAAEAPERRDAIIDAAEEYACAQASSALAEIVASTDAAVVGVVLGNNPAPSREQAVRSHVLTHAAEGALLRRALLDAADASGLAVFAVPERDLLGALAERLRIPTDDAKLRVRSLGKAAGRPWRKPEQLAAAVAWLSLVARAPMR